MTWTLDFETEGIDGNPLAFPPRPVGVGIKHNDEPATYSAGTLRELHNTLQDIWESDEELIMQNAPFDLRVAEHWLDLPYPHWERIHDTQFLLFLNDPHAASLSLKPSAEKILD